MERSPTVTGPRPTEGFLAQTPVVLVALAALVAIALVNGRSLHHPPQPAGMTSTAPAAAGQKAAAGADYGEVVAVRPLVVRASVVEPSVFMTFELEVRMQDGSTRVLSRGQPGFAVGDRVRFVNGEPQSLRS